LGIVCRVGDLLNIIHGVNINHDLWGLLPYPAEWVILNLWCDVELENFAEVAAFSRS
jgi:hypothetical protein